MALETLSYQALADQISGVETGAAASMLKLRASDLYQDLIECTVDVLGYAGLAYDPATLHGDNLPPLGPEDSAGILRYHLYNRAATIFGGSNEIQRNIIAKSVLGLPS
jgi:alkylation response protein AidB-like acyl-CoA dehydrogenase